MTPDKISTILDHIDSGRILLPTFQRGFVWNRGQVRRLIESLYRGRPIGGLLVWHTSSSSASHRGEAPVMQEYVDFLLDGQQRITSLYAVVRGRLPGFQEAKDSSLQGLRFHVETEEFSYYQPVRMRDDNLWIDVSEIMQSKDKAMEQIIDNLQDEKEHLPGKYAWRLNRLRDIREKSMHIETISGEDFTLEDIVDIFNQVNSGGTNLSKGDLAMAKISARWHGARDAMNSKLNDWNKMGYKFDQNWLLRSVNTVLNGKSKFSFLHNCTEDQMQNGLDRASDCIDYALNLISARLGLDHDRVFFGKNAIPVLVRHLDQAKCQVSAEDQDKLLMWFVQSGMWGRYSSSIETTIDKDIDCLDGPEGSVDKLLDNLFLWRNNSFNTTPEHFKESGVGARIYSVLYMLTRQGQAQDWGTGVRIKKGLLGSGNKLELHHIFPKSALRKIGYNRAAINAVANFSFQTRETNQKLGDKHPDVYFEEIEKNYPSALESQWIPSDRKLWRIENYHEFLAARRELLSEAINSRFGELLNNNPRWFSGQCPETTAQHKPGDDKIDDYSRQTLTDLNDWMDDNNLPAGAIGYSLTDSDSGLNCELDLAWPEGVQQEFPEPVAVILADDENQKVVLASEQGFRCFRSVQSFMNFVREKYLA